MIYYVRGDGGMPVMTIDQIRKWLEGKYVLAGRCWPEHEPREHNATIDMLLNELDAIEQQARR